jgi:glycosyltransferase involved in cell wall biosynthesis
MEEFQEKDDRMKIYSKRNEGLPATRNYCLDRASGEYVLNIDSDDWVENNCVEKLIESAVNNNADIAICDLFKEYKNKSRLIREPYPEVCDAKEFFDIFIFKNGRNYLCNKLIKKEIFFKNNIRLYEDISIGEDTMTLLRLIPSVNKIVHVKIPLYHYLCLNQGMSQSFKKNLIDNYNGLSKIYDYYKEHNLNIDKFMLMRLRFVYSQLAFCTLKKAKKMGLDQYIILAHLFKSEVNKIIKDKEFSKFIIKYKVFAYIYHIYLLFAL